MRWGTHGFAAFVAVFTIGCGKDESTTASTAAPPPLRSLESCRAAWQPLLPDEHLYSDDTDLAVDQDSVYFYRSEFGDSDEIRALSTADGGVTTVTQGGGEHLWLEGGNVLWAVSDRLFRVPTAGGTPTLVLDGRLVASQDGTPTDALPDAGADGRAPAGRPCYFPDHALDASYFYWVGPCSVPNSDILVWRMPRQGGPAEQLGALPQDSVMGVAVSSDAVVVGSFRSHAVPFDGGPVRELADSEGFFAGVDSSGVYWMDRSADSYGRLMLSPADGSPAKPIWSEGAGLRAAAVGPAAVRAWADDRGGWLVTASEAFDDGHIHAEIWFVDAAGNAKLAACDPTVDGSGLEGYASEVTGRPAFTDTAVYVGAPHVLDSYETTWTIVRIPRLQEP